MHKIVYFHCCCGSELGEGSETNNFGLQWSIFGFVEIEVIEDTAVLKWSGESGKGLEGEVFVCERSEEDRFS